MTIDKILYGTLAVGKYLDIRYCDEVVLEYLGTNTYKAITNYIHEDYAEPFREAIERAETDWVCLPIKVLHRTGIYRDVYVKIRKQQYMVKGIQLWDIHAYDIDSFFGAYSEQLLITNSFKALTNLAEIDYFKYDHATNVISFCRIVKSREISLFSMDLDEWSKAAFSLNHIAEEDKAAFTNFYLDIKMGKKEISVDLRSSLCCDAEEIQPCRFDAMTINKDNEPWRTVGCIRLKTNTHTVDVSTSNLDPLTGLYSKKAIADQAKSLVHNHEGNLALFILDVDNFKGANDNFGHLFGDKVLAKIADVIADVIGRNGVAGRFGGDEFMGVITNYADRDDLKGKMRSLRSRIEFLFANIPNLNITCSIGVCERKDDILDYDTLFSYADKCLYMAKDKGKNRYIIYLKDVHGDVNVSDGRIADLTNSVSHKNKQSVISDIILTMHKEGYDGLENVARRLITELNFDRIAVYYGEGFPKILCRENVKSAYDYAFFAHNREYLSLFDEEGTFYSPSLYRLQELDRDIYHMYTKQRTENFLQIRLGTADNIKGFLTMECCHTEKARAENMINYTKIIGRLMAAIIEEKYSK